MPEVTQNPNPQSDASAASGRAARSPALRSIAAREEARRGADTPFERVLRQALERRSKQASFYNRVVRPGLQRLADQSGVLTKNFDLDEVRFRLLRAGFPRGLRARDFVFLKMAGLIAMPFVLIVYVPILSWLTGWDLGSLAYLWAALIGAWIGFRSPDIWLATVTRKRQFEIQIALPDMIDLITISVEAGLGLYAAIQRVAMRFNNPLSEEFLRSLQEVRLGRSHVEAMRDLVRRAEVEDLTIFISSLIQAETLGVPIANVLRAQSDRLRDKRRQRAREQAQKAPLKMLFPLALFIFPALFVVILGPALLRVLDSGF